MDLTQKNHLDTENKFFKVGDFVTVTNKNSHQWAPNMYTMIGKYYTIEEIHKDGDCLLKHDNGVGFWFNPKSLKGIYNVKISFGEEYSELLSIPVETFNKLLNKELQITVKAI